MKFNIHSIITATKEKKDGVERNDFNDDYVVKSMGAFGRWQCLVCMVASLSRFLSAWNIYSILFLTPDTVFSCIQFKNNATMHAENSTCYDDCTEYKYYDEVFEKSLISEFNLICENAWLSSLTQTILMFGSVIGISIFGWVSDRFGRSKSLIISSVVGLIFMLGSSFATSYWAFTIMRLFTGISSGAIMTTLTVYNMEIVGPQYKEIAGSLVLMIDGIGQALLALFAYFTPSWNLFLLSYSCTSILIVMNLLFLPETPRWLVANGKADAAIALMTKAAKFNRLHISGIKENVTVALEKLNITENKATNCTYLDLIKTKKIAMITMISFALWFLAGVSFFGINQYLTYFGSNIFIVASALGLMQIPITPVGIVVTKLFRRKMSTFISLFIIAGSMITLIFLPQGTWITTLVGIIGLSSSCVTFSIIYVHATEIYPTPIRTMGFAVSSSGAKIGAMVAPFLASVRPFWVASLIFGVLPLFAGGICLLLPETKGQKLRDNLD